MKIFNFRDIFACNSSSTHSVVIVPNSSNYKDKEVGEYQWNQFCCATKEAKLDYFLAQLCNSLEDIVHSDYAKDIIFGKYGDRNLISSREDDLCIDHQSQILIPSTKNPYLEYHTLNEEFIKDLEEFLLRDDVVIFGGNDNDDTSHVLKNNEQEVNLLTDKGYATDFKARKDGNIWTIMHRRSGWKVRFSFTDSVEDYSKSTSPELVDIKIISTCNNAKQKYPAGCARFCYQSSSADGGYVSVNDFRNIVYRLSKMDIFEIALGGGEPLDHPNILELLRICRDFDIIPNITTRNYDWLDDKEKASQIFELVGQIAFSVSNSKDVEMVALQRHRWQQYHSKFVVQYVVETESKYTFASMVDTIKVLNVPVIFLGFKKIGNGIKFKESSYLKEYENYNVIDILKEKGLDYFGVDTAFIQKYEKDIQALGISQKLYYCNEGKFSFYIDAVEMKYGKSSYDEEMYPLTTLERNMNGILSSEKILERYVQW